MNTWKVWIFNSEILKEIVTGPMDCYLTMSGLCQNYVCIWVWAVPFCGCVSLSFCLCVSVGDCVWPIGSIFVNVRGFEPPLNVLKWVLQLSLINTENTKQTNMVEFDVPKFYLVSLILRMGFFLVLEPRCSYKVVSVKKRLYVFNFVLENCFKLI